jgi:hypothetical protein
VTVGANETSIVLVQDKHILVVAEELVLQEAAAANIHNYYLLAEEEVEVAYSGAAVAYWTHEEEAELARMDSMMGNTKRNT